MTKDRKDPSNGFVGEDDSGWLNRFLAEEDDLDRRSLWRLGSWGVGAVGALIVAIMVAQSPAARHGTQSVAAVQARQSQQVQLIAKESQNQARQLTAAVETLNGDRDRLYARVTVLEQGLDSVTGSLARQSTPAAAAAPPTQSPVPADVALIGPPAPPEVKPEPETAPKVSPVATTTPARLPESPNPTEQKAEAAVKVESPAAQSPAPAPSVTGALAAVDPVPADTSAEKVLERPVERTEFGVDLGGANSIEGLRALWRGAIKSNKQQLASLQPIIVIKERSDGFGMQLRLVAGPFADAAAAAKLCAHLTESKRACETSVFDGQRLALQSEKKPASAATPRPKRHSRVRAEQPAAPPPPARSSFSSIFGGR